MRVYIDQRVVNGFRRRALAAYPKEYIESLWGKTRGQEVYIYCLQPVDHVATGREIFLEEEDTVYDATRPRYEDLEGGLQLLGSIHSHPNDDPSPSEYDWAQLAEYPERVTGICSIWREPGSKRRRTVVRWYNGDSPLCEVVIWKKKRGGSTT